MSASAARILDHLNAVGAERAARQATPGLAARVDAIKAYQQARFARTYSDLLCSDRYAPAARFFLDELYGPKDFADRDAQFARVVPALTRLFPKDVIEAVRALAELHALSESLDTAMGKHAAFEGDAVTASFYVRAWQACGRSADRERQIALTHAVGDSLDRLTRKPLLRGSLRMMRGPAHAAGLGGLQALLERGFDAFAHMKGSAEFLALVQTRERGLAAALFAADDEPPPPGDPGRSTMAALLAALPAAPRPA